MMAYVILVYEREASEKEHLIFTIILGVTIIYPWTYESIQFYREGMAYFGDFWNWTDMAYYLSSIVNVILQFTVGTRHISTLCCMVIMVVLLVIKSFFYLRIFRNFTPIVIMLKNVMYDLRIFLLFYTILIFIFSLLFSVLGVNLASVQTDLIEHGEFKKRMLSKKMSKFNAMTPVEL